MLVLIWHIDVVRMLISEYKPNVDHADYCGQTPLHYACIKGDVDVVVS